MPDPNAAVTLLARPDAHDLLREIQPVLDGLVPHSAAAFAPDSVVGSITIEIDGERAMLFFSPEEPHEMPQQEAARLAAAPLGKVTQRIHALSASLFDRRKEPGHE